MSTPDRPGPEETHDRLKARTALVVCAYLDEERCDALIEGSSSPGAGAAPRSFPAHFDARDQVLSSSVVSPKSL
jgi:hypothetical protein